MQLTREAIHFLMLKLQAHGLGIPLLLLALLIRTVEGAWLEIEIAVIERDGQRLARWFAGEDFRERRLRRDEPSDLGWTVGVVSANQPRPRQYYIREATMPIQTDDTFGILVPAPGVPRGKGAA